MLLENRVLIVMLTASAALGAPFVAAAGPAAPAQIPPAAAAALHDFDRVCAAEGGGLWGVSLCGPMLLVDPATRAVTANAADPGGVLRPVGDLFAGVLPADVGIANTAVTWSGVRWSMVMLPLPEDARARRALMLHEAWHRIQDRLGLASGSCDNSHLEDACARTWMRLEWRALGRALKEDGEARRDALADALQFRARRHGLFTGSERQEACLELNEGLAEYTGERLAFGADAPAVVAGELAAADQREHLARSFAYVSGPAYGVLLDELAPGWRRHLGATPDLGALAAGALPRWRPDPDGLVARAAGYGYDEVAAQEGRLGRDRERRRAALRAALVDAPAVILPLTAMQMQFDPHRVVGLAPAGTVYLQLTAEDAWGRLEATAGALIGPSFHRLALPGRIVDVTGNVVTGDSWRLELADGWRLDADPKGPARVTRAPRAGAAPSSRR